uniref:NADH dehydrogenase [ubiquinone] 1 beta subcomplex subunit 6 n=1 Tax=Leptobrachium leishanense TaxID=445787 RepID=A0A8C5PCI2_9ANUR
MSGYLPDEKLRLEQLRALRRCWLKDQELRSWEPVLPPVKKGPLEKFWSNFLHTMSRQRPPYGIVNLKPRLFPDDLILETGEVIPPTEDSHDGHH